MTGGALVVREQDGIPDALRMMREKGVRRAPVVSDKGALVGILAIDDVLELVAEEMDGFVATLRSERAREVRQRR
jgi:CBS domain-containing protein